MTTRYVYLDKASIPFPRLHRGKLGPVTWTDDETDQRWLPACGTRVDVTCLEVTEVAPHDDLCRRCFPLEAP